MTIGRYGYDLSLGPNPDFQVEKTCVHQNLSEMEWRLCYTRVCVCVYLTSGPLTDAAQSQTGSVRRSADSPGGGGTKHGHVH